MNETTASERERFEAYFASSRKSKGAGRRPTFERREDDTYADDHTQRHWWTWQNARAALPAPADRPPEPQGSSGWISVDERMPPPKTSLLVVWGKHRAVDKAHTFAEWKHHSHPLGYLIQGHPGSHNDVTHWMPLPQPPNAGAAMVSAQHGASDNSEQDQPEPGRAAIAKGEQSRE